MIVVVSGPGGVGKGTVVARLVARDPKLRLSRSWTTRAPRQGESSDAYTFVDRQQFEERRAAGGFLESAEFLGELYGTPLPDGAGDSSGPFGTDSPEGADEDFDLVLEIEVQGAAQVLDRFPDALLVMLTAPSPEVQEQRLRGRGDPPEAVERRLAKAAEELEAGRRLGAVVLVNEDSDATAAALGELIRRRREEGSAGSEPAHEPGSMGGPGRG